MKGFVFIILEKLITWLGNKALKATLSTKYIILEETIILGSIDFYHSCYILN